MTGFYGADVDQLRALGQELGGRASELEAIASRLTPKVQNVNWKGPDAQRFVDDWHSRLAVALRKVAEGLHDASRKAIENAHAQADVSGSAGGTGSGLPHLGPEFIARIPEDKPGWPTFGQIDGEFKPTIRGL